ncbi:MAG: hypothetical protein V1792_06415 [Pseudomonadota bacterium]
MPSLFTEFSDTYERFRKQYPTHPLIDELRHRILSGRFPTNQWLRSKIEQMRNIMAPKWSSSPQTFSEGVNERAADLSDTRSME